MKRRYKPGDWFRVPLDADVDALGLIVHACRSRCFGYFFAIPADAAPEHADLRSLEAAQAGMCALFGGAALEDLRWKIIATNLRFDARVWPFPQFAQRGAFGRRYACVTYDPQTLAVVASEPVSQAQTGQLPPSRFASPDELESALRACFAGIPAAPPQVVYEAGADIDTDAVSVLANGGRLQLSAPLPQAAIEKLAALVAPFPHLELRLHGLAPGSAAAFFPSIESLVADVEISAAAANGIPRRIRRLSITGNSKFTPQVFARLPNLRAVELRGADAPLAALAGCSHLESLTLVDASPIDVSLFERHPLRELVVVRGKCGFSRIDGIAMLESLELRDVALPQLPDLSRCVHLRSLTLRSVRMLTGLQPLARAPALERLTIEAMPQLRVEHFTPLIHCPKLIHVRIDTGSRKINREVYRMLRAE